jgi:hypothetical protein
MGFIMLLSIITQCEEQAVSNFLHFMLACSISGTVLPPPALLLGAAFARPDAAFTESRS